MHQHVNMDMSCQLTPGAIYSNQDCPGAESVQLKLAALLGELAYDAGGWPQLTVRPAKPNRQ